MSDSLKPVKLRINSLNSELETYRSVNRILHIGVGANTSDNRYSFSLPIVKVIPEFNAGGFLYGSLSIGTYFLTNYEQELGFYTALGPNIARKVGFEVGVSKINNESIKNVITYYEFYGTIEKKYTVGLSYDVNRGVGLNFYFGLPAKTTKIPVESN